MRERGINPMMVLDFYKVDHRRQYPKGTVEVYSNLTPRSGKYGPRGSTHYINFGTQMAVRQLHYLFEKNFFSQPLGDILEECEREICLGLNIDSFDVSHIEALHNLGYLPIRIKALPEGVRVPYGIPSFTIVNTDPDFFWLTNALETYLSLLTWKPIVTATIAFKYKLVLTKAAQKTDPDNIEFVNFQGHDFSMRGTDSIDACISGGLGHAICFKGSDTVPVIHGARQFYDEESSFVIGSVIATEHSVMCAGGAEPGDELATFRRLMATYPEGILSIVSDTWNLWDVLTKYLPELKEEILARDGKLVIRPDSGDPVDIICGQEAYTNTSTGKKTSVRTGKSVSIEENLGVIELLWNIFGGSINKYGYKVLDSHIGAIYGDSITVDRAQQICDRLAAKGFASTNLVFGIGSFTYTYNTRDTIGAAVKGTHVKIKTDGIIKSIPMFKDPITDDGTKKSAKGYLRVEIEDADFVLKDEQSAFEEKLGMLEEVYENGEEVGIPATFSEIRTLIDFNVEYVLSKSD